MAECDRPAAVVVGCDGGIGRREHAGAVPWPPEESCTHSSLLEATNAISKSPFGSLVRDGLVPGVMTEGVRLLLRAGSTVHSRVEGAWNAAS